MSLEDTEETEDTEQHQHGGTEIRGKKAKTPCPRVSVLMLFRVLHPLRIIQIWIFENE